MKRGVLSTIAVVGLVLAGAGRAAATFQIVFDENGNGLYLEAGSTTWTPDPGVVGPDPSQGLAAPVLSYVLPDNVPTMDVGFYENGTSPDLANLSDVFRFSQNKAGQSVLIYYSDNKDGVDSLADTGFPGNLQISHWVEETGQEGGTQLNLWTDSFGDQYKGYSEGVVPEPFTIGLAAAGLAFAVRRRTKK